MILYLGFLEGLISHFEYLGQLDLNRNLHMKICKKKYSIKPSGRFK